MHKRTFVLVALLALLWTTVISAQEATEEPMDMMDAALSVTLLGTYETGIFDEGAQEIGAYDVGSQRLFVTNADANRIDVLDLSDPAAPSLVSEITLDDFGATINSVAVYEGIIGVAVEAEAIDGAGQAVFLNTDGEVLSNVTVGILPDMLAFSTDGAYALTANEGEPNDDYSIDPEGSVSIIDLSGGVENLTDDAVTNVTFEAFNEGGARADELADEVRIFGPNATVAQDLEPEYVATAGGTAFVTLQENNAIAVIDIAAGELVRIIALGFKDYNTEATAIDPSNEDDGINIRAVPVVGMYQPDAIAAYEVDGTLYIVSANEGDARDYDTFSEEVRVGDEEVTLDAEAYPNAAELQDPANLGRLLTTTVNGDTDGDGDIDQIYSYGARSFSIWTAEGELVYDSAGEFEAITAEIRPDTFNSNGTADGFDGRSDDKGPEPEGVVLGTIGESTYAFIGLERISGVMIYDVTDPTAPSYVTYVDNKSPEGNAEEGTAGDIGPEGLVFISAADSPTGSALLVVTNEVSGSTSIYELAQN